MIGVVIETSAPEPRPWSRYALTIAGLAVVFGGGIWLRDVCDLPEHIWSAGIVATGGYMIAHPFLALGYAVGGSPMLTVPVVWSLWRELRTTWTLRNRLALYLVLLGIAAATALTAALTLSGEDTPTGFLYYLALGVFLATALPGAGGLVHVLFAWRVDRKAGVGAAEPTM
ncbi:hypothetical protein Psi02_14370 [Planotetraspora silvatica]|uniref:Uncharacterized protein n=1 Tax=Planotetraspora silvatica TaxID=234614 RepID=A0A8J3UG91_9ACTN|nr:hypothetical protein Psi02_14370 [Planotetraspora silvatica]